jgi:hypothetical protein
MSQVPTTPTTLDGQMAPPQFPLAAPPVARRVEPVVGDPDYYKKLDAIADVNGPWSAATLFNDVVNDQWAGFQFARASARWQAGMEDVDPSFDIFKRWDEFTEGVDPAYYEDIARARSESQANILKAQFQDTTDRKRRIMNAGVTGSVASVAASFVDPLQVVMMLASGGAASAIGVARGGYLATMSGRAITAGFLNAGTQLPFDVLRAEDDPTFGGGDLTANLIGNAAFGAAGPLTEGASLARRVVAGGLAQNAGLPVMAFAGERADEMTRLEASAVFATQFLFGGAFNALPANPTRLHQEDAVRLSTLAKDLVDETSLDAGMGVYPAASLTEKGAALKARMGERRYTAIEPQVRHASDLLAPKPAAAPTPLTAETPAIVTTGDIGLGGPQTVQMRAVAPVVPMDANYKPGDFSIGNVNFGVVSGLRRVLSKLDFLDPGERFRRSANNLISLVGVSLTGDLDAQNSASLLAQMTGRAKREQFDDLSLFRSQLEKHNQQAVAAGRKPLDMREFSREVTKEYRYGFSTGNFNTATPAGQVARQIRDYALDAAAEAARKGDKSAARVLAEGGIHPFQSANREMIDDAIAKYGEGEVKQLFYVAVADDSVRIAREQEMQKLGVKALTPAQDNVAVQRGEAMARGMASRLVKNAGTRNDVLASISGIEVEKTFSATFAEMRSMPELANVSDADLESLVKSQMRDPTMGYGYRHAIRMNQLATHSFTTGFGQQVTLSMSDMLEQDAFDMLQRFRRAHRSNLAIRELDRGVAASMGINTADPDYVPRFENAAQMQTFLRQTVTGGIGEPTADDAKRLTEIDHYTRVLLGLPTYQPDTDDAEGVWRMIQGAMTATGARAMFNSTAAIQNFTEVPIAMVANWPTLHRTFIPGMKALLDGLSGEVKDETSRRLAHQLGMGLNFMGKPLGVVDDELMGIDTTAIGRSSTLKAGIKAQEYAQLYGHYAYLLSGNTSTGNAMETFASTVALRPFLDAADGTGIDDLTVQYMGLTRKQFDDIAGEIRRHARMNTMGFRDLRESQWSPQNAALFRRAVTGFAMRHGNLRDAGRMPRIFTNNPVGKVMTQLSAFAIQSWHNRALAPLALRDLGPKGFLTAVSQWAVGSAAALAVYRLGVEVNAAGRSDEAEYRKRMLSDEALAKAAFSRSAWAGFMPRVADMSLQAGGFDPMFSFARSTGLGQGAGLNGALQQTPLTSYIEAVATTPGRVAQFAQGQGSINDMRRVEEVFGVPSGFMPLRALNDYLYRRAGLPQKRTPAGSSGGRTRPSE